MKEAGEREDVEKGSKIIEIIKEAWKDEKKN